MTGHSPGSSGEPSTAIDPVTVDPITVGGVALHQRITAAAPELVAAVFERILAELPAYARMPTELLRGDVTRIIGAGVRAFAEVVRTGRRPSPRFLASLRENIAQRAEEGVPIDVVLSAHHLGVRVSWELLGPHAEPADLPGLLRLSRLQLAYLQDVTAAVSAGYFHERQAVFSEEQAARQALLSALLEGGANAEIAARAGILLPPSYLVLELVIGAHPDENRSDVDGSVAARRKLRRLRTELEHRARDPVLCALTPAGGVALVPCAQPADEVGEADWGRLASLVESASRAAGADATAGAVAAAPTDVGEAAVVAREVLDVALACGRPPGVHRLDDVALEYQLSRPGPAAEKLAALLEPVARKPELLETLRTHFGHGLNRRHTARALHIHPNTVDYRLRRIAALTGLDTTVPAELPRIRAALIARQALTSARRR
ncbi:PucR family transcriptional regulator [Saccharopolyspora erythraea]|uniref:PucR family transcriptional regulator n=1 Tax=Saccharopolyspora erythraea TaxID=1836 RepID=UPI0020138F0A|nr:helix-turn-helix domain-containing protein [Saccharopolyspora erythraea]